MRAPQASLLSIAILSLLGSFAIARQNSAPDTAKDHAAIGQTLQGFLDSWNLHDPHANAMLYTDDADVTLS
jgi:hypothetical protein